jgi:chromosome segregation ATPase
LSAAAAAILHRDEVSKERADKHAAENAALKLLMDSVAARLDAAEHKITAMAANEASLKQELTAKDATVKAQSDKLTSMGIELAEAKGQIVSMQAQIDKLQAELAARHAANGANTSPAEPYPPLSGVTVEINQVNPT